MKFPRGFFLHGSELVPLLLIMFSVLVYVWIWSVNENARLDAGERACLQHTCNPGFSVRYLRETKERGCYCMRRVAPTLN